MGGGGLVYEKKSRIYNQFKRNETYFLLLNRNFLGRRASSKSNNPVDFSAF